MWLAETSSHLKSRLEDFDRPRIGWFIAGKSPIKIQDPGICSICMDHMDMFNVCHVPKYQTVKTMLFCRKTPDSEKFNLLDPRLKVQCIYIILYIYTYVLRSPGLKMCSTMMGKQSLVILDNVATKPNDINSHLGCYDIHFYPFLVRLISDGSLFYHVRKENQNTRPRPRPCPPGAWIIRGHRSNNGHGTSERSIRGAVWCSPYVRPKMVGLISIPKDFHPLFLHKFRPTKE